MVRESEIHCDWVIVRPTSIWRPWFEHSYKTFFKMIKLGWYVQPGLLPIVKPFSFVGNTVYLVQKLLFYSGDMSNRQTYYLTDYPQNSIQEWADLIR